MASIILFIRLVFISHFMDPDWAWQTNAGLPSDSDVHLCIKIKPNGQGYHRQYIAYLILELARMNEFKAVFGPSPELLLEEDVPLPSHLMHSFDTIGYQLLDQQAIYIHLFKEKKEFFWPGKQEAISKNLYMVLNEFEKHSKHSYEIEYKSTFEIILQNAGSLITDLMDWIKWAFKFFIIYLLIAASVVIFIIIKKGKQPQKWEM
jgi:hypothetical protein